MFSKNVNRVVGALEAIAGGIVIGKSEEYGYGAIGKMAGLYFIVGGIADVITGKFLYLSSKIKFNIFKK